MNMKFYITIDLITKILDLGFSKLLALVKSRVYYDITSITQTPGIILQTYPEPRFNESLLESQTTKKHRFSKTLGLG